MAIDVRRFLTEYCQLYCGTPALDVDVVHLPTAVTANHAPDPLTGNPPLETRITVQIRQDTAVVGEGIDLGEAITETMAAIEKFSRPVTPLPIDIYRVIHTVSGQEVSEAEFIAAYPAEQQATAASGLLAPYSKLARGIVGEYLIELYTSDDPANRCQAVLPRPPCTSGPQPNRNANMSPVSSVSPYTFSLFAFQVRYVDASSPSRWRLSSARLCRPAS